MGNDMVTMFLCHPGLEFEILEKVGRVIVPYMQLAFKMKFSKSSHRPIEHTHETA